MKLQLRFRALGASLVDVFTSRVDLAAAELEDLFLRAGHMLVLVVASSLAAAFALMFLGLAAVVAVPEPYRWIPALGCGWFFGAFALTCAWTLRRHLRDMPAPFAGTRDVLHRDAGALRPTLENAAHTATSTAGVEPPPS
ncbi:MAG TPA: phage holin family protein [Opitutales bacterium]|nr:phage holin family protein [Opitutales bacterium]